MLEFILVAGLGVTVWVVLRVLRSSGATGASESRGLQPLPDAAPQDPLAALQDLPRRLYIEYRAPEEGPLRRSDVDVEALERRDGHLWVVGQCHSAQAPARFRADRILAFTDRHNNAVFKGARVLTALEAAADGIAAREAAERRAAARKQAAGRDMTREDEQWAGGPAAAPAATEAGLADRTVNAPLASERERALAAFREWAERDDWVLMACRATGGDAQAEIVEIAVLSAAGDVLLQQRLASQAAADAVPGADGLPAWPQLHDEVTALLAAAPYVLSYNALFQLRLLEQTAARYSLALPELEFDCVMLAYAAHRAEADSKGKARRHSLAEAAAHEGVAAAGDVVEGDASEGAALAEALTAWRLIDKLGTAAAP